MAYNGLHRACAWGGVRGMVSSYIAWYLFLAGAGGGAYAIGATVDLLLRFRSGSWLSRASAITDAGLLAGPVLVAISAVFLMLDLGSPQLAFQVFLAPTGSLLSAGAWSIALFCLTAVAALFAGAVDGGRVIRTAEAALSVISALLSAFVIVYAGIFLSLYPTVPFLNTPLIPVLFVASALATGAAVLITIGFVRSARDDVSDGLGSLVKLDAALVAVEAIVLALFIGCAWEAGDAQIRSVFELVSGSCSLFFWFGVVLAGLVVPLSVDIIVAGTSSTPMLAMGAACTLVGGLCLRFALLFAAQRLCLVDMSALVYWM